MSKLDARKESIAFLTKFFFVLVGVIVIVVGGLVSIYSQQAITALFWLGCSTVILLTLGCLAIFHRIQKYIQEIEKI